MENLDTYLQERLRVFKQSCDAWLAHYKQGLQSDFNQYLLGKIKEAEEAIETGKAEYVQIYNDSMKALEEQRASMPEARRNSMALTSWEESIKHQLESSLDFVEKTWKAYIERCKAQMT